MGQRGRAVRRLCALALATAGLVAPSRASADVPATLDGVVLRDGTRLAGRVRDEAPGRFVVIETTDGRLRTLTWDAVLEVSRAPRARVTGRGLLAYELRAATAFALYPRETFAPSGICATGTGLAPASAYGGAPSGRGAAAGGTLGVRAAFAYQWMPRIDGRATFLSLRAGVGLDLGELYVRAPRGAAPFAGELCSRVASKTGDVSYEGSTSIVATVPLTLGGQLGFGGFRDATVWRGVVVGLGWTPSYLYVQGATAGGSGSVRWLGVEATLDFTTLDVTTNRGAAPHLRLFATVLPPSGDGEPLVALLGLGAAWY